ncbi:hypothetical protein [Neogemmobacter tilapiae]|uniref:Uncharacterized protein n=1 Tax=Neogemmobacter tilapiae TaxID=875041 RepID=A0A918TGN9_9RHOB|nr:hypothetical protein [Gemmobacter tilapiae]GHC47291.1 hypothetical protein GCM10007315_06310 [Gemmobacter tilapiae]
MFGKTLLSLALIMPLTALAQQADGTWRCVANGNIPIGIVAITGTNYTFTATNTAFDPVDNASNGTGTLAYDGPYLLPQDGPLVSDFGVTGHLDDNIGYLDWNNNDGNLMGCRRA